MYQRERFIIDPYPTAPTYVYVDPYPSSVVYQYPYQLLVRDDHRSDVLLSQTTAIRSELSQIRNDIGEIRRRQTPPTYYVARQDYPSVTCSLCRSSASKYQGNYSLQNVTTYCARCHSFVEEPNYSYQTYVRAKTPTTTYRDSYLRPPPYLSTVRHWERRMT